jgi:hypothetical protein
MDTLLNPIDMFCFYFARCIKITGKLSGCLHYVDLRLPYGHTSLLYVYDCSKADPSSRAV